MPCRSPCLIVIFYFIFSIRRAERSCTVTSSCAVRQRPPKQLHLGRAIGPRPRSASASPRQLWCGCVGHTVAHVQSSLPCSSGTTSHAVSVFLVSLACHLSGQLPVPLLPCSSTPFVPCHTHTLPLTHSSLHVSLFSPRLRTLVRTMSYIHIPFPFNKSARYPPVRRPARHASLTPSCRSLTFVLLAGRNQSRLETHLPTPTPNPAGPASACLPTVAAKPKPSLRTTTTKTIIRARPRPVNGNTLATRITTTT